MGTPEFAVAPLRKLKEAGYDIAAVVTAPDRPAGRGKKIRQSAVKIFAEQEGIEHILQPEKLRDPDFLKELEAVEAELQIVVAFRMLPEAVWRIPAMGTFNLHASLLPRYRGAAPINHVLINGEEQTGVSTFLIDEQIDTGNILLQKSTSIGPGENAGELHDRLMELGASLVLETVQGLEQGSLKARNQDHFMKPGEVLKAAPKIHKSDCRIDWNNKGIEIFNLIRGMSPYPAAFTSLQRENQAPLLVKIYQGSFREEQHKLEAGSLQTDENQSLEIATSDGFYSVESLQMEGKKRMSTEDFLRGTRLISGQARFS